MSDIFKGYRNGTLAKSCLIFWMVHKAGKQAFLVCNVTKETTATYFWKKDFITSRDF